MKTWGRKKFIRRMTELVEYTMDTVPLRHDGKYPWSDEHDAFQSLEFLSHAISCYLAQRTTYKGGVDTEAPFHVLKLHKPQSTKKLRRRLGRLYDEYNPPEAGSHHFVDLPASCGLDLGEEPCDHSPNFATIRPVDDDMGGLVDVNCHHCGCSGSTRIIKEDIQW